MRKQKLTECGGGDDNDDDGDTQSDDRDNKNVPRQLNQQSNQAMGCEMEVRFPEGEDMLLF